MQLIISSYKNDIFKEASDKEKIMNETQQNTIKKNVLLGSLKEGTKEHEIMGYIIWWNINSVNVTRNEFVKYLERVNIDKKYAPKHNYRSALTRALKVMEENRLVRLVEDTPQTVSFQFTAEHRVEGEDGKELTYEKEAIIVVSKPKYRETGDFEAALDKCSPEIKHQLALLFNQHREMYNSSDITRYLQNIFRSEGDIVSLRPQGSVYFVPAGHKDLIESAEELLGYIGGVCNLENMPIPNVEQAREVVKTALVAELDEDFKKLESEVDAVLNDNKAVTETWTDARISRLKKMLGRIECYVSGGLGLNTNKWETSAKEMEQKILGVRKLDVPTEEVA